MADNYDNLQGQPKDPADHPDSNMDRVKSYMVNMERLASGTGRTAGQYGAMVAQENYDFNRKKTGLDK